jgi:hypothetical protein
MAYWYRVFLALESSDFQNSHCTLYVPGADRRPSRKAAQAVRTTFDHQLCGHSALGAESGEISQMNILFPHPDSNPGTVVKIRPLVACKGKAGCRYRHKPGGRALLARSGEQDAKQHTAAEPPSHVEICRNGGNCTAARLPA